MLLENAAHDFALDTCAAAMNDTNLRQSGLPALFEVFFHDTRDIFWMKGVEIDNIFDRENNGFSERRLWLFHFVAISACGSEPGVADTPALFLCQK